MKKKIEAIDAGSGDVFTDLGFKDAGERKLCVQLAMRINDLLQERRLTQAKVAALFGIPQPHISELKHYKLNRFSSERLMHFITLLDKDVEIIIRPKAKGQASGLVSVLLAA
jgi:predicted XRE-type DNA-binding protein